jgi:hypothetical protein
MPGLELRPLNRSARSQYALSRLLQKHVENII